MNLKTFVPISSFIFPFLILLLLVGCSEDFEKKVDFNAYYTNYDGDDKISGEYADIVIRFPDSKKFIFNRYYEVDDARNGWSYTMQENKK